PVNGMTRLDASPFWAKLFTLTPVSVTRRGVSRAAAVDDHPRRMERTRSPRLRDVFGGSDRRNIQRAIRECQAQLAATAPPESSVRAQLYPFFVSGRAR